jgi:hypothetical protein
MAEAIVGKLPSFVETLEFQICRLQLVCTASFPEMPEKR